MRLLPDSRYGWMLARPHDGAAFLRDAREAADECEAALLQYPRFQIGALEFHYGCLQSMSALDVHLLADFQQLGRPGLVWAAWLVALLPSEANRGWLQQALPWLQSIRCDWSATLALEVLNGREPVDLGALRASLCAVAWPAMPLRLAPTAVECLQLADERARVGEHYIRGGADAARRALRGTLFETLRTDYLTWRRSQLKLPP